MRVGDTYRFLVGSWSLNRTIADYESGLRGWFHGTAELHPAGSGPAWGPARYDEVGQLRLGAYEGAARRSLVFVPREDATVLVNFGDGRRFIECDLRTGLWHARHLCGDDTYELTFDVRSPDVLDEHWRVRGPSTDYEAWTTLRRSTDGKCL